MEVINGGYKKGMWFHDRAAYSDEEIEYVNGAFRRISQHDPRWLKLIWNIKKPESKIRHVK
jgi:hypothetical protein